MRLTKVYAFFREGREREFIAFLVSYSYRCTPESYKIPHTISFNNTYNTFLSCHSVIKPFYLSEKLVLCLHHYRKTLRNIWHKRVAGLWPTNWIRLACLLWRGMLLSHLFSTLDRIHLLSRLSGERRQCTARAPTYSFGTGLRKKQKQWNKLLGNGL